MSTHSTGHEGPTHDLEALLASLTGPVAILAGVVVETIGGAFRVLLDQAYQSGVDAGHAQAEYRVARMVGTRATVASHGADGTLVRCDRCGGDGLVVRTEPPAPYRRDPNATAVIPRLDELHGETTLLPRINDPTTTSKFDTRGRRD
jgi:hypothetical protein